MDVMSIKEEKKKSKGKQIQIQIYLYLIANIVLEFLFLIAKKHCKWCIVMFIENIRYRFIKMDIRN